MIEEMLLLTVNLDYYSKIYDYCIITTISTFLFRIYHYYFMKLSVNKYFVFLQKNKIKNHYNSSDIFTADISTA